MMKYSNYYLRCYLYSCLRVYTYKYTCLEVLRKQQSIRRVHFLSVLFGFLTAGKMKIKIFWRWEFRMDPDVRLWCRIDDCNFYLYARSISHHR